MKFLHTSDWHVGRSINGRSRLDEHRAVLAEIRAIAATHDVDAVLVAGDLYETAAPSVEAQKIVIDALAALRADGREVIALAGNHDHAATFDAYRALMAISGIQLLGRARRATEGGLVTFEARSDGTPVQVAAVPFIHQRYAVRAAQLLTQTPAENAASYDEQVRRVIAHLQGAFTPGAVHITMAHLMVTGGLATGGERAASVVMEYSVPAPPAFGDAPHYVALGHLHRHQTVAAPCPVRYSGSPLPLDYGEQDNENVVLVVDVHPDRPANVTAVPLTAGRRLRTVTGTYGELAGLAEDADSLGDDWLRVVVTEPARAGLSDDIYELLPNTTQVQIHPDFHSAAPARARAATQAVRNPGELFREYLTEKSLATDDGVLALFDELYDEHLTADTGELFDIDPDTNADSAEGTVGGAAAAEIDPATVGTWVGAGGTGQEGAS